MARDTENSPPGGAQACQEIPQSLREGARGLRVSVMTPLFDKILNLKNSTLVEDTEEMVKSN